MEWYKGVQEPATSQIWFYPIGDGNFECRVYGSKGWQPITQSSIVNGDILVDILSYGVEWDVTQSTPELTRVGNMALHKSLPIQNSLQGCIFKDGVIQYYLNPTDWTKKATIAESPLDDNTAKLDGTDGDVMVHHMKFYGRSFIKGNKRQVRISTVQIDDTWQEIPEGVISAYRAALEQTDINNKKLRSVVNTTANFRGGDAYLPENTYDQYLTTDPFKSQLGKPISELSRQDARTYARNNGVELLHYNAYKWICYWLPVIEYATFNMQKPFNAELTSEGYHQGGLGLGIVGFNYDSGSTGDDYYTEGALTPCGYTNDFGNFSGVKYRTLPNTYIDYPGQSPVTVEPLRYRGIENIFGDINTELDGCLCKGDDTYTYNMIYVTDDPNKFSDSDFSKMQCIDKRIGLNSNTIKEFILGNSAEIIPESVVEAWDSSYFIYKTDGFWTQTSPELRYIRVGGNYAELGPNYTYISGLGFMDTMSGYPDINTGYRLYKQIN